LRRSNTETWPSKRIAAPDTSGLRCFTQARLMAWRVAKLSVQSSTTSARATSASSASPSSRAWIGSSRVCGLRRCSVARAEATLGRPTMSAECMIWRCRLVRSTVSWSASARVPTPAAARYIAAGDPSPPAPTISARASSSACWPSTSISGSRMWRL